MKTEKRTTVQSLTKAKESNQLLALEDSVLDRHSEIIIHACGLGNNETLLSAIQLSLGGSDAERPIVRSSKYFISYLNQQGLTNKYLTESYYTYYRTGYRPGDIRLARSLEQNNNEVTLDFRDALTRKQPRKPGDVYHYSFNIPVNWMVTYASENEVPILKDQSEEMTFLKEQETLLTIIKNMEIPIDKFRWQFRKTTHTFEDGTTEPAIQIRGKTTVICVLVPITKEGSTDPLTPEYSIR